MTNPTPGGDPAGQPGSSYEDLSTADLLGLLRVFANAPNRDSNNTIFNTYVRLSSEIEKYTEEELKRVSEDVAASMESSSYRRVSTIELVMFSRVLDRGPHNPNMGHFGFYAGALNQGFYVSLLSRIRTELANRLYGEVMEANAATDIELAPEKGRRWF